MPPGGSRCSYSNWQRGRPEMPDVAGPNPAEHTMPSGPASGCPCKGGSPGRHRGRALDGRLLCRQGPPGFDPGLGTLVRLQPGQPRRSSPIGKRRFPQVEEVPGSNPGFGTMGSEPARVLGLAANECAAPAVGFDCSALRSGRLTERQGARRTSTFRHGQLPDR
jgi:hypothetical protein